MINVCRHPNGILYPECGLGTWSSNDIQTVSSWNTTVENVEDFDGIQITSSDYYCILL